MMPLPTAVAQTARATRFIRPTLLSVFLETPHCRRISFLKRGTGYARTTNTDAQSQLRSRRLATQSVALTAEGRRKRVLKVENEERLEDLSKESSPLAFHLYSEPNLSKKQHRKGKSTFVEATEESSQTSNVPGGRRRKHVLKVKKEEKLKSRSRESSKKQRTEGKSSIIEALETPPRASSLDPMSDEQTRSCEYDPYDEEAEEEYQVFKQAPNPPLPKHSSNPHKSLGGINGKAAAIAYLRIRGLANCGPKTTFYTILGWVLRHAARELGFEIVPDGFVRISDLLQFELFHKHTLETFAEACTTDTFDRFEVISLPDLVNGELREVWWARARACQTIPGVHSSNKRIINMGRLQTVIYRAPFTDWPNIQKYGILEDPDRVIRLYQSGATYFHNVIPRNVKYICITIDAQRASELGVKFFHTMDVQLLAVGRNGTIPVEAIRSVVELEVSREDLI